MPRDEFGNVADMTCFSRSVTARMNGDQSYEQWIIAYMRDVAKDCVEMLAADKWKDAWEHLTKAYSIAAPDTYQVVMGSKTTDEKKIAHLKAVVYGIPNIQIRADATHVNEFMYMDIMKHRPPNRSHIHFVNYKGEWEKTIGKGLVAPKVVGILEKTANNPMASSTARTQHHSLPSSSGIDYLVKEKAPRVIGETESRSHSAIIGACYVNMVLELSTNPRAAESSAELMYSSKDPMGEPHALKRKDVDLGGNSAKALLEHTLHTIGACFEGIDIDLQMPNRKKR